MAGGRVRPAAFDLDGTLLRGGTVCEVMARPPGRPAVEPGEAAVVGDSAGDVPMLQSVAHRSFVRRAVPPGLDGTAHHPEGDLLDIARRMPKTGSSTSGDT